jgi:DNA-binding MarR family transcriptional regulator
MTRAPDPIDLHELAARVRLSTARLARVLRQQAGTGLSASQTSVLVSISMHGPLTLGHLARVEQVTPPTITKVVSRLEEDGLVVRTVDATDRRHVRVSLTREGQRRLEHSRQRRNAWLAERLQTMSGADRRRLETALPLLEALVTAEVATDPANPTDTTNPAAPAAPETVGSPRAAR